MRGRILCSLVLVCLGLSEAWGLEWSTSLKEIKDLQLVGGGAKVVVTPMPQPNTEGRQITLKVLGEGASAWAVTSSNERVVLDNGGVQTSNEVVLQVAPQVKVNLSLKAGSVALNSLSNPVSVRLLKGEAKVQDMSGSLLLNLQKGEIDIGRHRGSVEIETYSAEIGLKDVTGDVQINNFSGETRIQDLLGKTIYKSYSGALNLNKAQGLVQFENQRGVMTLSAIEGRIEGENQEGNLSISPSDEADVHIKSAAGRVVVRVSEGFAPYLNLRTMSGDLLLPTQVKPYREARYKVARGRSVGKPQGAVNVSGEDVDIQIR